MSFLAFLYVLFVSFLLVSTLPVLSGKRIGKRVPPEMVLPIFVVVVLFVALLVTFPWEVLTVGTRALSRRLAARLVLLSRIIKRKDADGGRGRRAAIFARRGSRDRRAAGRARSACGDGERPGRLN